MTVYAISRRIKAQKPPPITTVIVNLNSYINRKIPQLTKPSSKLKRTMPSSSLANAVGNNTIN